MVGWFIYELACFFYAHLADQLAEVGNTVDSLASSAAQFYDAGSIGGEHAEATCVPSRIRQQPHDVTFAVAASLRSGRSAVVICCCTDATTSLKIPLR